ncbi:hypothetical protein HYPSUDRAFT_91387 [Hypholoma sublateritium FD-334 SS-4]|uniref:Uncharacterized protein n=1 Tax=Hypholoma sublateritium (strain FD-334 SS-4) TaxID=945553 RepID=A0A0D2LZH7_HYPSF|nr:hypothetical protein HYPSUDRAFT_91387 [Hypholoma sublateritium FD-334 SS-4]
MKFTSILTSLFGACAVLLPVLAAPVDLERRNTGVPSHIHYHSTFYRAVTGGELAHIHNYQPGHHPATYNPVPGDFAHGGALYVFADKHDAELWGDSFSSVALDKKKQTWYLVEFSYTPGHGLSTHSFHAGTEDWKNFVNGNYAGHSPHIDIVEGPVSVGHGPRLQAAVVNDKNIYQAAFASPAALSTLVVTHVSARSSKDKHRWCPSCNIM